MTKISVFVFARRPAFNEQLRNFAIQLKKASGKKVGSEVLSDWLEAFYSLSSSFYKKGTAKQDGTQIDLLIDRKDHVINLFEIKFYNTNYTVNKTYAEKLRDKMRIFKESTKTNKQIFWVFLSTFGLNENEHSQSIVMKSLSIDALFD